MRSQIFINLPVSNLEKAVAFYTQMGMVNNPQFSDDTAKCMVFSEEIFVMIMTHEKFQTFTSKPIADLHKNVAALLSLSVESVEKVNKIVNNALTVGGKEPVEAKDYGFMQQRTLEDLDGHTWEIFFMDISKFPQ
jgi:uncharacterized protein